MKKGTHTIPSKFLEHLGLIKYHLIEKKCILQYLGLAVYISVSAEQGSHE